MLNGRLTLFCALAALSFNTRTLVAEERNGAAPALLGTSKHTLDEALQAVVAEGGVPISVKFEVEEGKLWLSVYGAKGGLDHCAERNELFELKSEAALPEWHPLREVFEDKEHIARASAQLTLMQTTSLTLEGALKQARNKQQGTIFSLLPVLRKGKTAIVVGLRAASGESTSIVIEDSTK